MFVRYILLFKYSLLGKFIFFMFMFMLQNISFIIIIAHSQRCQAGFMNYVSPCSAVFSKTIYYFLI